MGNSGESEQKLPIRSRVRKSRRSVYENRDLKEEIMNGYNELGECFETRNKRKSKSTEKAEEYSLRVEDYEEILQEIKSSRYKQLFHMMSKREAIIYLLKSGTVNHKKYSNFSIAKLLNMEEGKVEEEYQLAVKLFQAEIEKFDEHQKIEKPKSLLKK